MVPARAAEPSGQRFSLSKASMNLSASRSSLKTCAIMCWASVTGWACCMCVNPGMTVLPFSSATFMRLDIRSPMPSTVSRTASLRYILKSVATWSLRLLPVWSFPPAGPMASVSLNSTLVWMSSSSGSRGNLSSSISESMALRPSIMASASSAGMTLHAFSILTWASDPITS